MNWKELLKARGDVEIHQTSGGQEAGSFTPGFHPDPNEKRTIKLYLAEIKKIYEMLMERQPTDKEAEQHFLETLYHESGHAAHEDIDKPTIDNTKGWDKLFVNTKDVFQKEWVAFSTQFPDKPYYVMQGLLHHGFIKDYSKMVYGQINKWLIKTIPDSYNRREQSSKGAWGQDLVYEMRNKLLDLHWKYGKVQSTGGIHIDLRASNVPKTKKEALDMYGEEHKEFIKTLKLAGSLGNPWKYRQ
tara:strand:+ start:111 stop:839 length:729 start_codon:yes stop_codon:yes gene_type:complete